MLNLLISLPLRWPHTIMLCLAAFWIALAWISAPFFHVRYIATGTGAFILVGYCLAFIVGSAVAYMAFGGYRLAAASAPRPRLNYAALFWLVSSVAMVGVSLRLLDHLIIHPHAVDLGNLSQVKIDAATAAAHGEQLDTSLLSLIAGPLTGFCFFPPLIVMLAPDAMALNRRVVAFSLVAYPALDSVVFHGGSSAVAYTLIFLLNGWLMTASAARQRVIGLRAVPAIATGTLVAVVLGSSLFVSRIIAQSGDLGNYLSIGAYGGKAVLVPSDLSIHLADTPGVNGIFMSFYWLFLYITSGVYNFIFVAENFFEVHTLGATQAELISRAISIIQGGQNTLTTASNPLPGLYQTAFGNVFIDFGFGGGLIESFLLGFFAAGVHAARLRGRLFGIFVDPVAKAFLVLAIFVSSFSGAGMFYLLAAVVVSAIAWLLSQGNDARQSRKRDSNYGGRSGAASSVAQSTVPEF